MGVFIYLIKKTPSLIFCYIPANNTSTRDPLAPAYKTAPTAHKPQGNSV